MIKLKMKEHKEIPWETGMYLAENLQDREEMLVLVGNDTVFFLANNSPFCWLTIEEAREEYRLIREVTNIKIEEI